MFLALNLGVSEKDKSKVWIISGKFDQEGFSALLRQDNDSAETRIVTLKASYLELSNI